MSLLGLGVELWELTESANSAAWMRRYFMVREVDVACSFNFAQQG